MRRSIGILLFLLVWSGVAKAQSVVTFEKPVSLNGSAESLLWQNQMVSLFGLSRFEDESEISEANLVKLESDLGLRVDERLKAENRFVHFWVLNFLRSIGTSHLLEFQVPLQINSAVRSRLGQKELGKKNANAAPTEGPKASPHLTGSTIDISKVGWSSRRLAWFREELLKLERDLCIEATEEFFQQVFHVMVFPVCLTSPSAPRLGTF